MDKELVIGIIFISVIVFVLIVDFFLEWNKNLEQSYI